MRENSRSKNAKAILRLHESGEEDPSHPSRAQQVLYGTAGVLKVDINHVTNVLSVEYDPDTISLDEIKKAIERSRAEFHGDN